MLSGMSKNIKNRVTMKQKHGLWSRYCEYKNPNSEHCKKDEYFEGRKDAEVSAASDLNKSWGGYSTFRPMRHALQERDQQTLQREWFDGK